MSGRRVELEQLLDRVDHLSWSPMMDELVLGTYSLIWALAR